MDAGQFRHRIEIKRRSTALDAYGGQSTTWTTVLTTHAKVTYLDSYERVRAQRVLSSRMGKFTIRYTASVTEKDVISFNSLTWNIIGIAPKGHREYLELTAEVAQ